MIQFVGVFRIVGNLHAVERGGDAMGLVVAVEGDFAAAGDAHVVQGDVAHGWRRVALQRAVGGVGGVERDGVRRVADANVVVDDVLQ